MEQPQIQHQILFMRSAKNPAPRWVYVDEQSGLMKLCDSRSDGDVFEHEAMPAAVARVAQVWADPVQRNAWMRVIPVTKSDDDVAEMVKEFQATQAAASGGAGNTGGASASSETPAPKPDDSPADKPATPELIWHVEAPAITLGDVAYPWEIVMVEQKVWRSVETPRGKYWQAATKDQSKVFWQSPADIAADTGKSTACLATDAGHKRGEVEDFVRTHFDAYTGEVA